MSGRIHFELEGTMMRKTLCGLFLGNGVAPLQVTRVAEDVTCGRCRKSPIWYSHSLTQGLTADKDGAR